MKELFDVYTRDGEYLGTESKEVCHGESPEFYHKPAWVWIVNDKKEILVQRRASTKKNNPNLWDMSSAGHVVAGEKVIDGAVRETYEELGIETKPEDYNFLFEYIYDQKHEIAEVYMLKSNLPVSEMKLQPNEVAEAIWLNYEQFKEVFLSDKFCPQPMEYKEKVLDILKDI